VPESLQDDFVTKCEFTNNTTLGKEFIHVMIYTFSLITKTQAFNWLPKFCCFLSFVIIWQIGSKLQIYPSWGKSMQHRVKSSIKVINWYHP